MVGFNLDLLKHELHRPTEGVLDTMYANSHIPIINRATRVTRNTCTLKDNIFTNSYSIDSQLFRGILKAAISDHYMLFQIIKSTDSTKKTRVTSKQSELSMNLESMDLWKKFRILAGLY